MPSAKILIIATIAAVLVCILIYMLLKREDDNMKNQNH